MFYHLVYVLADLSVDCPSHQHAAELRGEK